MQRELPSAVATAEAFCTANHIPEEISNRMKLALDEVLSNIVKYAYDEPECGIIDVELTYADRRLVATVGDSGKPFNPLLFPGRPTSGPLASRREGGLGIVFVTRLMDSVDYDRSGDQNRLTLTISVPFS